ncbi:MAG: DEAD/DEAH box helicase [Actinobacteria bacterium]|nr:DEAD/DEAH box helicase [Actinomycetota bacterium]MBI3686363.1 DEAD/DEAH box helicase [Actinomycetota bacterium]
MSPARSAAAPDPSSIAPRRGEALLARLLPGSTAATREQDARDPGNATHRAVADTQKGTSQQIAARSGSPVTHIERLAARTGRCAPWPTWVPEPLVDRLGQRGIAAPWEHQVTAAELAWSGRSVVIATGTASGKSLAYQLPVLSTLLSDSRSTALYLAPTKALAADQLLTVRGLALPSTRAAPYDGDTPSEERDWARAHARWVFSNPDMLSRGMLPAHPRWARFLRRLRFVVLDECHGYRGIFGSHVAHVVRRLRRVCEHYGAAPTFVLASATVADPAELAGRLVGLPVTAVTDDTSPRGAMTFALWEPPLLPGVAGDAGAPTRRSAPAETARLLADLVVERARTIAFVRSRRTAEVVALMAQRSLGEVAPGLDTRVAAYRAGYLPEERRALEARLASGDLLGVAATNALELGIDIVGLDAVILCGYPGTVASVWQQAGRAGRAGQDALAVLIARDDPLDAFLAHHPEALFGRPVEATVLDPDNPHVLAPQLCAAAAELPLTDADLPIFGAEAASAVLADLVRDGPLRRRPTGWYWTARYPLQVDIRGAGDEPVQLVEAGTGRILGTVDRWAAHAAVHPGAVYLHQGRSYVVDTLDVGLDVDLGVAVLHPETPDWTTSARDVTELRIVCSTRQLRADPLTVDFGTVDVTNRVVSYLRRRLTTGEVLAEVPLDLPARNLRTRAVWYSVTDEALARAGLPRERLPGAAHAAEHAAIGLLPLFATCDRWDIGGVSTAAHQDTGECTVFVYDGHPGGAGFAARGFDAVLPWLTATRATIEACECETGCPSCVQSPKCGNGNHPLDKDGAAQLLEVVLAALRGAALRPR